ncbi:MAG: S1 RNA-binding domain-containing protein [Armatimonadetes bacterium]|nr:S1 RNA-binding domain-containing protein [Candidatus Hippobium faecium]
MSEIHDDNITMDDVMASIDQEPEIVRGKIIEGTIVRIDKDGIMVDIGAKSEAKIPLSELSGDEAENPEAAFKVGDSIKARVQLTSSKEGIILSKKTIDYELRWDEIKVIFENKEIVKAVVKEANKGGLRVDLRGYPAFCPNSQVWGKAEKKTVTVNGVETEIQIYEKLVGETLEFEIKEMDKSKHKIILSNRDVVRKQKEAEKKEFWQNICVGQTRKGVVKSLTSYGAFINLGGSFDGMLHISEMSWNKIASPKDILSVGDEIEVYVFKADPKEGKISLSLKRIQEDPWNQIPEEYPIGRVFSGKITRVAQKAAFVDLGKGMEGLIPISEISTTRINVCGDVVKPGDEVTVKVIDISENERKVVLSMKAIEQEKIETAEQEAYEEQIKEDEAAGSFNLGEYFKDELKTE